MTTATQTITEFLEARIAEDEAAARLRDVQTFGAEQRAFAGVQGVFDPARVLAECEAKRRIVAVHSIRADTCETCTEYHSQISGCENEPWPCATIRALASVYADHPDFDPAWLA
jgi:hypothetical protein